MIPSTELRLRTMLRAMSEAILPALDQTNALAREQAALLMGHLDAMLTQAGGERELDRAESEALAALARRLCELADGGPVTTQATQQVLQALEGDAGTSLSLAVEQLLIAGDASDSFKEASWQPTLDYAREAAARGQQWFKPMGF